MTILTDEQKYIYLHSLPYVAKRS